MSEPRLREILPLLFEGKNQTLLHEVLLHLEFETFKNTWKLEVPTAELVVAFTHTSFAHEYHVPHQELLEFLGDSVLQLVLTDEVHQRFPLESEGNLSKLRSSLVNEKSLSKLARALKLDELILVGRGEFKRDLMSHEAVLADTLEAVIGRIYKTQGFEFTRKLVLSWFNEFVPEAYQMKTLENFDAKSKLQEAVLGRYKKLPRYTSEPKGQLFEIKLWINDEVVASGEFASKKSGEKELAQNILDKKLI